MKLYGLTGGIGMGKSTAAKLLQERGMPVVDTDTISRTLVEPGQPALAEIKSLFGPQILDEQGSLRRAELARIVFNDPAKRAQLEAILHPRIRATWQKQAEQWRVENKPCAVVVIPLLFETGAVNEFDRTICVSCSAPTQMKRLRSRSWNEEQIQQRIAAQWPINKKMELSNFVVWSEGSLESHKVQLDRLFSSFAAERE